MLTEGRLADSVWRVEDKDYSNAAARRPFISFMLHRMSLLLALSGHSTTEFRCPLLGVKRASGGGASMSAFDPKRTSENRRMFSAVVVRSSLIFGRWVLC